MRSPQEITVDTLREHGMPAFNDAEERDFAMHTLDIMIAEGCTDFIEDALTPADHAHNDSEVEGWYSEALGLIKRYTSESSPCWVCHKLAPSHTIIWDDHTSQYAHETCL